VHGSFFSVDCVHLAQRWLFTLLFVSLLVMSSGTPTPLSMVAAVRESSLEDSCSGFAIKVHQQVCNAAVAVKNRSLIAPVRECSLEAPCSVLAEQARQHQNVCNAAVALDYRSFVAPVWESSLEAPCSLLPKRVLHQQVHNADVNVNSQSLKGRKIVMERSNLLKNQQINIPKQRKPHLQARFLMHVSLQQQRKSDMTLQTKKRRRRNGKTECKKTPKTVFATLNKAFDFQYQSTKKSHDYYVHNGNGIQLLDLGKDSKRQLVKLPIENISIVQPDYNEN
jgi:hypothetical protein